MAERPIDATDRQHGTIVVSWVTVSNGDTLAPYQPPVGYDLESVQVQGTFDSETFTLTGSNDGTNFSDFDNGLSAEGIGYPTAQTFKFSGSVSSSGGSSADLDVHAFFRQRA